MLNHIQITIIFIFIRIVSTMAASRFGRKKYGTNFPNFDLFKSNRLLYVTYIHNFTTLHFMFDMYSNFFTSLSQSTQARMRINFCNELARISSFSAHEHQKYSACLLAELLWAPQSH